jgi:2-phosphosulfolactate phosphatase
MRATTSICAAIAAGAKAIIPVGSVEEARKAKEEGYILAAERDGVILDFADFGNSPDAFTPERVAGKVIAYSTTNGTQAIKMAADGNKNVVIGAFVNVSTVVKYLKEKDEDVLLFCAGWKNRFSLEDSLCAGLIADRLIKSAGFETHCDSTIACMDLWTLAEKDLIAYIEKCSHRHRLKGIVSEESIRYCHTLDVLDVLPVLKEGKLVK